MREPGGANGLTGHGREEGPRRHGGAAGSKGWVGVRDSEAGGGDKGSSSHRDPMETGSDPTEQMVGWGWTEELPGDSGGNDEDWYRGGGRGKMGGGV